ncbi:hypothetical protein Pmani_040027 [Petrolisthes manimaculis]|uniref:GPI mannosyltransferase 2 n=1 Tax=Petrolisthes manimaculis TaxID=1843537 RepID=A0AAE1NCR3_9EUCA|nr:hypothetical protein Pmani_040027 [Petrolisthes manimaculis]
MVLVWQAVSNFLIPDHQADAFVSPEDPNLHTSFMDRAVKVLLGGLVRWDAHYFMHIAQYGYTHENTLAFFPLYPLLVRFVATILGVPLRFVCNHYSVLLVSAVLVNMYLFVKTAIVFHKLSIVVLRSEVLAYRAALLFCINPASVFFSAPYSEALYAFVTFSALLVNETRGTSLAALPFGLASATRSNGLVNVGFILYKKLQDCSNYFYTIRNATTDTGHLSLVLVLLLTFNYTLIPLFVGCVLVLLPFALFQVWCYLRYCQEEGTIPALAPHLEMFVRSNFLHSPDLGEAEWCYSFPPIAYSHIQDKYWEVGFLRYYEVKQVPNFVLALPVVMLIICHAALYMVDNPQVCWGLGIHTSKWEHTNGHPRREGGGGGRARRQQQQQQQHQQQHSWPDKGINSWRVFSYTAHSLVLCAFCVLCIHVQVTTRLLCSSCPVVYWFAAHLLSDQPKTPPLQHQQRKGGTGEGISSSSSSSSRLMEVGGGLPEYPSNMSRRYWVWFLTDFPRPFWGQVVLSYFALYFFVGIVLYANFLPWT